MVAQSSSTVSHRRHRNAPSLDLTSEVTSDYSQLPESDFSAIIKIIEHYSSTFSGYPDVCAVNWR